MSITTVHAIDLPESPNAQPTGQAVTGKNLDLIGHLPVSLAAQVGSVSITVDRLFALRKGEVLAMNEGVDTPITLQLNGKAIARGELVAVDDHFGIRITELS